MQNQLCFDRILLIKNHGRLFIIVYDFYYDKGHLDNKPQRNCEKGNRKTIAILTYLQYRKILEI